MKTPVKHKADPKPTRFRVKVGGRYGYIDPQGKLVVEPSFYQAKDFCGGYAAVMPARGQKYGFIDESGRMAVQPAFGSALEFSEGHAWGNLGDRFVAEWVLVDETGKPAFAHRFRKPGTPVHQGRSVIPSPKSGKDFCVVDLKGRILLTLPDLYDVFWFSDGMALFRKDVRMLNVSGPVWDGEIATRKRCGFLDERYAVAIRPDLEDALHFSEGFAPAARRGKYGFIHKRGKFAVHPRFDYARPFAEGLAAVRMSKRKYPRRPPYEPETWAYVDKSLRPAFRPFEACEALSYSEGFARILVTGSCTDDAYEESSALCEHVKVVDKRGNVIFEIGEGRVSPFRNGLASVRVHKTAPANVQGVHSCAEDLYGYIDTTGKYVWEPQK